MRLGATPLVLGAFLLAAASARAQVRVVVYDFEGPKALAVEKVVTKILTKKGMTVLDAEDAAGGFEAAIRGKVANKGKRWGLKLTMIGADDAVLLETVFAVKGNVRKLKKDVKRNFWDQTGEILEGLETGGGGDEDGDFGGFVLDLAVDESGGVSEGDAESDDAEDLLADIESSSPKSAGASAGELATTEGDETEVDETEVDETEVDETEVEPSSAVAPEESAAARVATAPAESSATPAAARVEISEPFDWGEAAPAPLVRAKLRVAVQTRDFGYKGRDTASTLTPHTLKWTPMLAANVRYFPGKHFGQGIPEYFGIEVGGHSALGLITENSGGLEFPTQLYGIDAGVRARYPLGLFEVGGIIGWGMRVLEVKNSGGVDPGVPDVSPQYLRFGGSGRVRLFDLVYAEVQAAFLQVVSVGELGSPAWFPNTSGAGTEVQLELGAEFLEMFGAGVGWLFHRFEYDLGSKSTDPGVVDGTRVADAAAEHYNAIFVMGEARF